MSAEIIAIIVSALGVTVTIVIGLFGAMAWLIRRVDERIDGVERKLGERIDRMGERIDGVERSLGERIDGVERNLAAVARELTEVKVAVARWEGPKPRLILGG
ncbi:hypothetical protein [Microbacterium sp.]|uniref:hypothetical protein n=1 Tax=Microbacterium sp. TaxID=51671 RepID=UPI0039E352FC